MAKTGPADGRYVLLDGMRGIAAIAVLLYHLAWQVDLQNAMFSHAYLAVDFFFMLSGFVIADAYMAKLDNGTLAPGSFVSTRLIRLYPMIAFGSIIAFVVVASSIAFSRTTWTYPMAATATAASFVLEPFVPRPDVSGLRFGFPLNEPLWSLFWEFAANIAFVVIVAMRCSSFRAWAIVTAVFASAVVVFALTHNGLDRGHHELLGGFLRVGYSFPLGIAIWNMRAALPRMTIPVPIQVVILTLIFALPRPPHVNALYDIAAVIVIFPVLLMVASRSDLRGGDIGWAPWLGAISYPLYATHDPLMTVVKHLLEDMPRMVALPFILLIAVGLVWLSGLVLTYIDVPLRVWLGGVFAVKKSVAKAQTAP